MIQIPKIPKFPWAKAPAEDLPNKSKPWLRNKAQEQSKSQARLDKFRQEKLVRSITLPEQQERPPVYEHGTAVLELPDLIAHQRNSEEYVEDIAAEYTWKRHGEDGAVISQEGHVGAIIDGISGSKRGYGYVAKEIIVSVLEEEFEHFPLSNTKSQAKQLMVDTILKVAKAVNDAKVKEKSVSIDAVYSLTYTFSHTDTGEIYTAVANIGDNTVIALRPEGNYYTISYLGGQQSLKIPNTPEGEIMRHKVDEQETSPKDPELYAAMFQNNPKRLAGRIPTSEEFEASNTKMSVISRRIAEEELVSIYRTPPGTLLVKMSDGAMNNTLSQNTKIITDNIDDLEEAAAQVIESNAAKMLLMPTTHNARSHPDDASCQIIKIPGQALAQTKNKVYN
jgi:hypothetical protein